MNSRATNSTGRLVEYLGGDLHGMSIKALLTPSDHFSLRIVTRYICIRSGWLLFPAWIHRQLRNCFDNNSFWKETFTLQFLLSFSLHLKGVWLLRSFFLSSSLSCFRFLSFLLMKYFYHLYLLICEIFMSFRVSSQQVNSLVRYILTKPLTLKCCQWLTNYWHWSPVWTFN